SVQYACQNLCQRRSVREHDLWSGSHIGHSTTLPLGPGSSLDVERSGLDKIAAGRTIGSPSQRIIRGIEGIGHYIDKAHPPELSRALALIPNTSDPMTINVKNLDAPRLGL